MKITQVEAWPIDLKLSEPYTIAYETIDMVVNVIVRIETDQGLVGYGCAAPDEFVTGENHTTVLKAIYDVVVPIVTGADPLRMAWLLEQLKPMLRNQYAALAAVDLALHDLLGKIADLPLWQLLGGYRDGIITSITIGILPEAETVARAEAWVRQGFRCLKLKGGQDVEADVARVRKVREAVGKYIAIRFDANQGYTVEQTIQFVTKTQSAGLEFIEQPTPKRDRDALKYLSSHLALPVMADESVLNVRDTYLLVTTNGAKLINVKLMKMGGIAEALRICEVARAGGVHAMVGCMDESVLGIAAGLHVALAQPNVKYADLDGHIGLLNDPFAGGAQLKDGMLFPSDKPGLGCEWIDKESSSKIVSDHVSA